MLYFSELQNKKVYTEDEVYVGVLRDVIFLASENPTVTKLVVKTQVDDRTIIPMEFVKKFNGGIILKKNFQISKLVENELFLTTNLLNNQIIDISGDKMVRVNDVAIQDKPGYYIAGVDIGILGVLRWFGLEDYANKMSSKFGVKLASPFLSWADIQTIELTRGQVKIKTEQTKLQKIRPEDLADYLEETNVANIKHVLKTLHIKKAAEVINNLNLNYQRELFKQFESEEAAQIIAHMDAEEAADVLATLSKKKREKILSSLNDKVYNEVSYLLNLSKTPVGDILTTEFLAVDPNMTVKQVIERIKAETTDFSALTYIYVLNQDKQLAGVVSLHELLLQDPETQVLKFMTQNVTVIYLTTPEVVVLRKLIKFKLFALPVIDRNRHMLGLVTFDDVSELITKI